MLQRFISEWREPDFTEGEKKLFTLLYPFRGYIVLNYFEQHYLLFLVEKMGLEPHIISQLGKMLEKAHQHNLLDLDEENGWYLAKLCPGLGCLASQLKLEGITPAQVEEAFLNYAFHASRAALYYLLRAEEEEGATQEGVELMRYEESNMTKALYLQIQRKMPVAYYFTVLSDLYRYNKQYLERLIFCSGVLTAMLANDYANTSDECWLDYLGIQNAFADACLQMNMLDAAEKMLLAAVETAEVGSADPKAKIYLGYTCHNLALALSRQHRPTDCVKFLTMATNLLQDSDDDEIKGQIALNLGVVKLEEKEPEAARLAFGQALFYFQQTGAHSETAFALQNLGLLAEQKKDPVTAKRYYQDALDIFRRFDNEHSAAQILINLGSLAGDAGDLEESICHFKTALETFLNLDDDYYQALCYRNIGVALTHQQRWEQAKEMLFRALRSFARFQPGQDISRVFRNIKSLADRSQNPALIGEALQVLVDRFEVPLVESLTGHIIEVA